MGVFKKCFLLVTLSVIFISFCTKPCSSDPIDHGETDYAQSEGNKHDQNRKNNNYLTKMLMEKRDENKHLKEEKDELLAQKKKLEMQLERARIINRYRTRFDVLQWSLAKDPKVQELWKDASQITIKVPTRISSPKEIESYRTQYTIWFAIVKAMQQNSEDRRVSLVKELFEELGISVQDADRVATAAATLFTEITVEVENNEKEVRHKDENEVVAIFDDERIEDRQYQQALVRAIYRVDLN